jgi:hypothetical protein
LHWLERYACHTRPTHFGRRAKGRQLFLLAFIATRIASAAAITTHHHRQRQGTGDTENSLHMLWEDIFLFNCAQDYLSFGNNLTLKHVYGVDNMEYS